MKEFSTDKNLKIESEKFSQERQNKDSNKVSISIEGFESKKEKEEVVKTVIPEEARPKLVEEDITFAYDEIKYTKYLSSFK